MPGPKGSLYDEKVYTLPCCLAPTAIVLKQAAKPSTFKGCFSGITYQPFKHGLRLFPVSAPSSTPLLLSHRVRKHQMDTTTTKGRSLVFARHRERARCSGRLVPRRGHSRLGLQGSVCHPLVCDTQALDHLLAEYLPALRAVLGSHPALLPLVSSCNLSIFQRIPHTCSKIICNCVTPGLARGRGKGRVSWSGTLGPVLEYLVKLQHAYLPVCNSMPTLDTVPCLCLRG